MPENVSENAVLEPPKAPTLLQLFTVFATISLYGFGGVLPWTYRVLVEERRWLTAEEFNELFSLSQFLPGPNTVNLSIVFGSRFRGARGAAVTFFGLIGPPVVIISLLGFLYVRYGEIEMLRGALTGIAAAAAGLLIAVTAKMALPLFRRPFGPAPFVAAAGFIAIGLMRWPLPWVLLALVPVSLALAWWRATR
ncbi:MAG: chromate transporter [Hyphomicrobiales bacterium]